MRFHQRLLSGWLLLVTLMSSHPAAAELSERKTGFLGRTTELTVMVQSVVRNWRHPDTDGTGGLFLTCDEGSGEVRMSLLMHLYRLKNTNPESWRCHSAAISLQFDAHPPLIQSWPRPRSSNTYQTFVTTHDSEDSSCQGTFLLPAMQLLDLAISATALQATIGDLDTISLGPNKMTYAPPLHFDLEPVRAELIELQRRCRKKQ